MNPRPTLPHVAPDDELTADAWDAMVDEIAASRILDAQGLDVEWTPEGTILRLPLIPSFYHAKVGGSDIAAASAGQMTSGSGLAGVVDGKGKITYTGLSIVLWNKAIGGTIPANAEVGYVFDEAFNRVVTWWECS